MYPQIAGGSTLLPDGFPADLLDTLLDALASERRLVEDLIGIMQRQRAAVAADDLQAVDDSVYATHRVLLTLGEARRRRHSLNRALGESETLGIGGLDTVLGERMSPSLRTARDGLQVAALELSREVEINRTVLREALATGHDYVRAICGAPEPKLLYAGSPNRPEATGRGGVLLNRKV